MSAKGWFPVCVLSRYTHPTVSRQQLIILISVLDLTDIDGSAVFHCMAPSAFLYLCVRGQETYYKYSCFWMYVCVKLCIWVLLSSTSLSFVLTGHWSERCWHIFWMSILVCVILLCASARVMGSVCAALFPVPTSPSSFHVLYQPQCLWTVCKSWAQLWLMFHDVIFPISHQIPHLDHIYRCKFHVAAAQEDLESSHNELQFSKIYMSDCVCICLLLTLLKD